VLTKAEKATTKVDRLTQLHEEISQEIQFIIKKIKVYYNRTRFKNITLKKSLFTYTKHCDKKKKN